MKQREVQATELAQEDLALLVQMLLDKLKLKLVVNYTAKNFGHTGFSLIEEE